MNDKFINEWVDLEKNYVKRFIKKIVQKLMAPIIREIVAIINTVEKIENKENQNRFEINDIREQLQEFKLNSKQEADTVDEKLAAIVGSVAKNNHEIETIAQNLDMVTQNAEKSKEEIEIIAQKLIAITQSTEENANKLGEIVEIAEGNTQDIKDVKTRQEQQWNKMDARNSRYENDQKNKLGAIARELTEVYWSSIDFRDACQEKEPKSVVCSICGYEAQEDALEKKETDCIFGGGHLVRHVCPQCGGIFGPTKFSDRCKKAVDDDYVINYTGYTEADSTEGEVETFMMLHPDKDGIYLNYGCGVWAETIVRLNGEGYHVYGYEPYASDIDNPYLISDIKQLSKMRFDGIFSHDLLEHLKNPIEELRFMKSLLRSPSAKMAHSTACYEYKFEYTRFHTCFYTGNAIQYLCEKLGMRIVDYKDDGGPKDFICYVYGVEDGLISVRDFMHSNRNGEKELVADGEDGVIFGPYLNLVTDTYRIFLDVDYCGMEKTMEMIVTADSGKKNLSTFLVQDEKNEIQLDLAADEENVEFVFRTEEGQKVILKDIGFL